MVKETARYLKEQGPAICQRRREDQELEQTEGNAKVVSKELKTRMTNPETRESQEKIWVL